MKKVLKLIGVIFGSLILLLGIILVAIAIPAFNAKENARPLLQAKASEFIKCLYGSDLGVCNNQIASQRLKSKVSIYQLNTISSKMKAVLGERLAGEMVDGSFDFNYSKTTDGPHHIAKFQVLSIYQNDPRVLETYVFEFDPKLNDYVLTHLNIGSDKMVQ